MGHLYKTKDSRYWKADYYCNGIRLRQSTRTTSKTKALHWLKIREGQASEGKLESVLKAETIRFNVLTENLIKDYQVNGKKSTIRIQQCIKHLNDFFSGRKVKIIKTSKIRQYIYQRQEEGATNATINRELAALKRMFNLGRQAEIIETIPYIPTLKENNIRTGFFEHHEYVAVRDILPDYLKGIFVLAYYTGMRIGEIRNLKWNQVDLIDRKIILNSQDTKNQEPRVVYLSNEPYQFMTIQARNNCEYVFSKDGHRVGDFRKAWWKALDEIGINGKLFHDLRRTAVRNMIRNGIPEKVAMAISGHKTRSVFDRYNITSESDLKKAAEKMNVKKNAFTNENKANILYKEI